MAFTVNIIAGEPCDACRKMADEPMIMIAESTRADRNVIFIHRKCLDRAIAKADKKEAAK